MTNGDSGISHQSRCEGSSGEVEAEGRQEKAAVRCTAGSYSEDVGSGEAGASGQQEIVNPLNPEE